MGSLQRQTCIESWIYLGKICWCWFAIVVEYAITFWANVLEPNRLKLLFKCIELMPFYLRNMHYYVTDMQYLYTRKFIFYSAHYFTKVQDMPGFEWTKPWWVFLFFAELSFKLLTFCCCCCCWFCCRVCCRSWKRSCAYNVRPPFLKQFAYVMHRYRSLGPACFPLS